jgi:tRNA threonylcarbamoyl adenosine modification protein YeaZ
VLILAFDTSSPAITVAVVGAGVRAESEEVAANRHGEVLAAAVDRVLRDADATPADLTAVAVGLGPGPFTGLRVGIVTARAMSDALGIPAYGECSLDVIAAAARGDDEVGVLTDARRKQVYWARYDAAGRRVEGPELAPPDELADHLRGNVTRLVGAGAIAYRDRFGGFLVDERDRYPKASQLASMVTHRHVAAAPADDLTPLYLRRPDAQVPGRPKVVTPS